MPKFIEQLYQGTSPFNSHGGAFTANLPERELIPKGKFLKALILSLKGDLAATTTTATETFLDVLTPLVLKKGQETILQLRGRDLYALSFFLEAKAGRIIEGAAGEDDKVMGIEIPLNLPIEADQNYSWGATRAAVANVSGEQLGLEAIWNDEDTNGGNISAVEQPFTTAGATGPTSLNVIIPQIGELIGLIVFNTTVPTATADTSSITEIKFMIDGVASDVLHMSQGKGLHGGALANLTAPGRDVVENYSFFDFRDKPYDAKSKRISLDVEVGVATEAVRFIPIMRRK